MNAEAEKAWVQLKGVEKAVKQAVVEIDRAMKKPNIDPGEKDYMDKLKEALKNEQENIEDFEALIKGGVLKIGVFGSPSRGKSTLLNALLGIDMLPMDGKHGTTRFGTRLIKRKEIPNPKKPYKVERILTGAPPESKDCDAEDVSTVLKYFADKEAGEKNSKTKRIDIEGPFDSFIDDDLIFIDTPGISEPSESSSNTGHDFERDRKYALEILSSVDIVIFCLRADAPERDDVKLYNETFFDKYEPINVITFANERDDMTILDLKRYLKETYHLMLPDTVAVDAKKAV
ncbi:MAG: dynamin family protein, partial [Spirochaetes bacterium]|nr:dynamin family protein [Spirochaetota bacterium]